MFLRSSGTSMKRKGWSQPWVAHMGNITDGGFAEMEDQLDLEFFVEWLLHVHQAAGGGKLMQFTAYFAPVGQPHEREYGSPEFDAKRAVMLLAGIPG